MTPRGAIPDDFAQWRRHVERQLRNLAALASYRPGLKVDVGDFNVSGGGNIVLADGGNILVNDGGAVELHGGGELGIYDDGYLNWYGANGNSRVYIGQIYEVSDGSRMGPGILAQKPDGEDLFRVAADGVAAAGPNGGGWLTLGTGGHDNIALHRDNGNAMFDVWQQDGRGPTLATWRYTGENILYVTQTDFDYYVNGERTLHIEQGSNNTLLQGGPSGSGGWRETIVMVGGSGNNYVVRFRDGANNTWIDIAVADVNTPSSGHLKNVEGDADKRTALDEVLATPIKRWRYKPELAALDGNAPRSQKQGETSEFVAQPEPFAEPIGPKPLPKREDMRLRTGPVAEEAPESIKGVQQDDDQTISLSDTVFTLWAAVQELHGEVDRLQTRVDELESGGSSLSVGRG